jgi:hypothetical protein
MLRRIEVKKGKEESSWCGVARGNSELSDFMSKESFCDLRPTWGKQGVNWDDVNVRHFFTEEGWDYCGRFIEQMAADMYVPYRIVMLEEDRGRPILYKDEFQVAVPQDAVNTHGKFLEKGAGA